MSSKTVTFQTDEINGMCGVQVLNEFGYKGEEESYYGGTKAAGLHGGQAGLVCAAFIKKNPKNSSPYYGASDYDEELSEDAYKRLAKRFKIVYESEWRINFNTHNLFKFVVYDSSSKKHFPETVPA